MAKDSLDHAYTLAKVLRGLDRDTFDRLGGTQGAWDMLKSVYGKPAAR